MVQELGQRWQPQQKQPEMAQPQMLSQVESRSAACADQVPLQSPKGLADPTRPRPSADSLALQQLVLVFFEVVPEPLPPLPRHVPQVLPLLVLLDHHPLPDFA